MNTSIWPRHHRIDLRRWWRWMTRLAWSRLKASWSYTSPCSWPTKLSWIASTAMWWEEEQDGTRCKWRQWSHIWARTSSVTVEILLRVKSESLYSLILTVSGCYCRRDFRKISKCHSSLVKIWRFPILAIYWTTWFTTSTRMTSISGLRMEGSGSMAWESRWLSSSKSTARTKRWWFLQQKRSKRQLSWIFKSTTPKCWRSAMWSLISTIRSNSLRALRWRGEASFGSRKFFRNKSSLNSWREPTSRSAMLFVQILLKNILLLFKSKDKRWILVRSWIICNSPEC